MLDVAAPSRRLTGLVGPPRPAAAEEIAEQVAEVGGIAELLAEVEVDIALIAVLAAEGLAAAESEAAHTAPLPLHLFELLGVLPLVAPPVVCGALVRVAEHVVGGVDFLEAGFGVAVAAGDVGVILAGQFAIC